MTLIKTVIGNLDRQVEKKGNNIGKKFNNSKKHEIPLTNNVTIYKIQQC